MPRPRQRICLEQGLKIDLNRLIHRGSLRHGTEVGPYVMTWTNSYTGEVVAEGLVSANMESERGGWFRIQLGGMDQWIDLVTQPRHFGGWQWYFKCPLVIVARSCGDLVSSASTAAQPGDANSLTPRNSLPQ
jgi:hypothetical protein